jgi:CspA family cold shock protein
MEGTVRAWLEDRGFGFISPAAGGADVFVHVSALGGLDRLDVGDVVEFEEEADPRTNRPRGANVTVIRRAA